MKRGGDEMLSEAYMPVNDPGMIIPFEPDPYYSDEPYEDEELVTEPVRLSDNPDKLNSLTLSEIYDLTPTDDLPIIDGLLYPGVYILAGAPKIGKSFLAAQIAFHVSRGIDLFGHKHTRQRSSIWHWKTVPPDSSAGSVRCSAMRIPRIFIWQSIREQWKATSWIS